MLTPNTLTKSFAAAAAVALAAACVAEAPVAPERLAAAPSAQRALQDLPAGCEEIAVEAGHKVSARIFATGVQIYRWNGSAWAFDAPEADLYPNDRAQGRIGTHFRGPRWRSVSGSEVLGAVVDKCTPNAGAIPWLLLRGVSSHGPGPFDRTTFIQRVSTVGGNAPAAPGAAVGEEARVPYTAEYVFYRAR